MPEKDVKMVALSKGTTFNYNGNLVSLHSIIHKYIYAYLLCRLIKHTEKLLEETEEKLCVKVLRTLREMMAIDPEYGEKVSII